LKYVDSKNREQPENVLKFKDKNLAVKIIFLDLFAAETYWSIHEQVWSREKKEHRVATRSGAWGLYDDVDFKGV
jgi:hypothetical protein